MTSTARLRAVTNDEPKIVRIGTDYEAIGKRDWSRVHIQGDRNPPLWMPDRLKRIWR